MSAIFTPILLAQIPTPTAVTSPTASATAAPSATPNAPWRITLDDTFWASAGLLFLAIAVAWGIGTLRKSGKDHWLTKLFSDFTNALAYFVILLAFGGILGLSCAVLHAKNDLETAKYVFAAVLPLLGTWVGTVLAHYFQKENLSAATQSISSLVSTVTGAEKLKSIPVKNVMIHPERIDTLPDPLLDQTDDKIKLSDIVEHLRTKIKRDRIPIFKGNKKTGPADRVLHRSTIEKFVAKQVFSGTAADKLAELTLAQLMADPDFGAVVRAGFAIIKSDSTLADAKTAMDNQSASLGSAGTCYDVFVTDTGKTDEVVIGWITNDIINENAKV